MIDRQSYASFLRLVWIPLFLVPGILAGCGTGDKPQQSSGTDPLQKLTGDELQTILSPDSVVVKRIESMPGTDERSLTDFQPLTGEHLAELQAILTDEQSYDFDIAKACLPVPGVLIVFKKGSRHSEVRLCYACNMVGFTPGDWEDFDPIERQLIAWAKGVFPDDDVIGSLSMTSDAQNAR